MKRFAIIILSLLVFSCGDDPSPVAPTPISIPVIDPTCVQTGLTAVAYRDSDPNTLPIFRWALGETIWFKAVPTGSLGPIPPTCALSGRVNWSFLGSAFCTPLSDIHQVNVPVLCLFPGFVSASVENNGFVFVGNYIVGP